MRGIVRRIQRLPVGRSVALTIGVLLLFAVIGIGVALVANAHLSDRRAFLLNQIGPSLRNAIALEGALVDEETGVRGYVISGRGDFLEPYKEGLRDETRAYRELHAREGATGPRVAAELAALQASVGAWRERYVEPTLKLAAAGRPAPLRSSLAGKALFDDVRGSLARLQSELMREDLAKRGELSDAARLLNLVLVAAGVLIIGSVVLAGLFLRAMVTRPLARLGAEAARVTDGDFSRPIEVAVGPREIRELGIEIDAMRERIVEELARARASNIKLARQSEELGRSNAELEQFAYVASHDLQEPLRKVASFCQALRSRYHGQLDERADQYIEFAVDGAQRMQVLIDALLALSRVGRGDAPHELLALNEVAETAERSLNGEIEASGARVLVSPLGEVVGDRALLISVFQNLIGNAIKFRGEDAPVVRIDAARREHELVLSFADNGIGIEPEYAERIFQIFQRLHARDAYDGTGIGLALCRKIAEHHLGRIWLDADYADGARFFLTLPLAAEAR